MQQAETTSLYMQATQLYPVLWGVDTGQWGTDLCPLEVLCRPHLGLNQVVTVDSGGNSHLQQNNRT